MNAPAEFGLLIGGVFCVLIFASAVAAFLKSKLAADQTDLVIENLTARINAWWAMVALLAIAMLFGRAGAVTLFALLSFAAMREFLTLTAKSRADHYALATAFFFVLP
ncbi:phosphatidate cytidylyltransferase, partial [Rhodobacteraceae bacterium]|nr:phosphatidate cytidylyltransferase [Paracoccaceae bacterium]